MLHRVGATSSKRALRLGRFKSDRAEIWHDCSSELASIDGVGLRIKGKKVKVCIAVNGNLTATECHLPYGDMAIYAI